MNWHLPFASAVLGVLFPELIGSALLYAVFILVPIVALGGLLHYALSLPMRRQERARFFIDLLETALMRGDTPERVLVQMAATQDRAPGVRFHLIAAYLEQGDPLSIALAKVPRFLPPQITAMLTGGQHLNNLPRVVQACRELLQDAAASVRSAESYAMVLLLTFSPLGAWIIWVIFTFVLPKFEAIMADLGEGDVPLPPGIWQHPASIIGPQILIFLGLLGASVLHLAGPRSARWLNFGPFAIADWLAWVIPWKRQRLQRLFSRMLTAFLDAGLPEASALTLAADCTANQIVRHRAARAVAALAAGARLPEAVSSLDSHGEFHWRLKNAMCVGAGGFLHALSGWHESLEARAFRGEQTATHLITTALVLLNGLLVAFIAFTAFGTLIAVLNAGALW